ncbi:MAG: hypothetical protein EZS28_001303 [Streblomastix strix]|uniref:Uncharacterized protein n=1 Tax=Streblomastix strix TaxID=222440 RepID=A0A5J4X7J3_9EUKA|nr:MAG: hypothetical protein EZS28_001303 [Streblomastix strix]
MSDETLAILRTISPRDPRGYKEREPERKYPKLQQYAGLMDVVKSFHEIMKPMIEEEKKKPKILLSGQYKEYSNKDGRAFFYSSKNYRPTPIPRSNDLNLSEELRNQFALANHPKGSYIPRFLNISDGMAGFINIHPQIYQSILEAVKGLIVFAAKQIIQSETDSNDQEQLTNELERVVADRIDDNEDEDQSMHVIEPKHLTNGNDGLRKNDSGTQLKATVNGEANPFINITKISANTPPHNVNGSDGLGGNGCQPSIIITTSKLGKVKGKVAVPKQRMLPTNDHDTRSKIGLSKSVPNNYLGSPEARVNSDTLSNFVPQQEKSKKADVAQATEISPQNALIVTRPVQDPRNRNMDSTSKTRQKQSPITRLTSRISWTEQERKEKGSESRDLESCETDKENREILDGN